MAINRDEQARSTQHPPNRSGRTPLPVPFDFQPHVQLPARLLVEWLPFPSLDIQLLVESFKRDTLPKNALCTGVSVD
jgi:hypothetical protein